MKLTTSHPTIPSLFASALFVAFSGSARSAEAEVALDVSVAHPALEAGKQNTTFLKVGLTGFEMEPSGEERPSSNVALVIDQSGSMEGTKIEQARDAARMAVEILGADDILSVIAYSSHAEVLVPATKLTDKAEVLRRIDGIRSGGGTALYAGVERGAAEVQKFLSAQQVNRVILLSDGLANEGPSTPLELSALGKALGETGVSVTTIGLGLDYGEDLMAGIAAASDGNHVFVQEEAQLAGVFAEEFSDILSVCAQGVGVRIECGVGVRPVRVLGRDAAIEGQTVSVAMNQLYGGQEKYVLLEVEVAASAPGSEMALAAEVGVSYTNMAKNAPDELSASVALSFTESVEVVENKIDKEVLSASVLQIATNNNERAMRLRDEGQVAQAKALLQSNCAYITDNNMKLNNADLAEYGQTNIADVEAVDTDQWGARRKAMTSRQLGNRQQQVSNGKGVVGE